MTQQKKNLSHEEKLALNNYAKERRKTSVNLYIHMRQILCRDKMVSGFIFGLLLGIILGGANFGIGTLKIKKLNKKDLIKTQLQQKLLEKKRAFSTMIIVDILLLLILSIRFEECREILSKDFQGAAKQLAKGYFKKIFEQEHCTKEIAQRAKHAAALIVNTLPQEKLDYMRALAVAGLSYDPKGRFQIDTEAVEAAQEVISAHLDAHPEIQIAVNQIMNNEKIQTYVLGVGNQKTK